MVSALPSWTDPPVLVLTREFPIIASKLRPKEIRYNRGFKLMGKMNTTDKELNIRLMGLKAKIKQVENYYIEPDRSGSSTEPGISNPALVRWKEKRLKELKEEIIEVESMISGE